ncbi:MAG: TonB-dependent receptor plug domain-containing protein [Bacteroidales bacterium]|nr:TonB-dependent receptor plug domain-containing protein [Bacteroidales bacterium]
MKKFLIFCLAVFAGAGLIKAQNTKDTITETQKPTNIPVISLTDSDIQNDAQSQDISGLLQSSDDVYVSVAGYTFGQAFYRIRGYNSEYYSVLINGVSANDPQTGRAFWSNWGGLNDATRSQVEYNGLSFSSEGFGDIGGMTNILTRASQYTPQTKVSYSIGNKSYRHRVMFTHSTGLLENGWAFTVSGSRRWAVEGYTQGTFYDAWAYFVSAEKVLNSHHSIGFTGFASPSRRGRSSVSTQEVYDLTGNNYYNSNWGYQNGKVRNARVNNYHQPNLMLTHYWKIDEFKKLTTSVLYMFGKGGATSLNWYDSADPRPDYYRYLPSYYTNENEFMANYLADEWREDENFRQLDWDGFYDANRKNLFTILNVNGIEGQNLTGNRAKYMVEERRTDVSKFNFNSVYNDQINENIRVVAGIDAVIYKGENYKIVSDLLGADWWLDIDQFAERDFFNDTSAQADLDNVNRPVGVGDKFGYDYIANINTAHAFGQAGFTYKRLDFYAGIDLAYSGFYRTGLMRNGMYPNNSKGDSEHYNFFNYQTKAGLTVKLDGRNFVVINGSFGTRAPYFDNIYISPRTRDYVVDSITSETVFTGDLSYVYRSPVVKARITGFYSEFRDQTEIKSFYHDELRTFVNYVMTGMDKRHYGGEFGIEVKVSATINIQAAFGYGRYLYNSRPLVTIAQDNSSEVLASNRTVYMKNYHVGGAPELAGSVGFKYNAPKYWFVGVNANYFDENYVDINPERRTAEALTSFVVTDPQWRQILDQEKLDPAYTIDIWGGKSWRISGNYLGFTLSVDNILNKKDNVTRGFEQLRYDQGDVNKFPSKYMYMYGRTYMLNVYYRF